MLIGQSLLLGELVDWFTDVNTEQVLTECVANTTVPDTSTRDAYLAAFGESYTCCLRPLCAQHV